MFRTRSWPECITWAPQCPQAIIRAFLSEALSEGGSVNPGEPRCVLERAVITDDGHAPTRIAEADFNTVLTNAYLIWLVKD